MIASPCAAPPVSLPDPLVVWDFANGWSEDLTLNSASFTAGVGLLVDTGDSPQVTFPSLNDGFLLYVEWLSGDHDATGPVIAYIDDGSNANRVYTELNASDGLLAVATAASTGQFTFWAPSAVVEDTRHKLAIRCETNNGALWVDDQAVQTDSTVNVPQGMNRFFLGDHSGNPNRELMSELVRVALYPAGLSDAQAQALTLQGV